MPKLPPSAASTVAQFAAQMEIDVFEAADGAYSFDFENSGRFSVVATQDNAIVISLTGKIIIEDLMGYAGHAERGGYDPARNMMLHTGLNRAGQPVLAMRTDTRGFDLPFLQQGFELLAERMRTR